MDSYYIGAFMFLAAGLIVLLPKKHAFLKKHEHLINFLIMFCPCMYNFSLRYGVAKTAGLGILLLTTYAIIYWPKKNDFMKKHKILINSMAILCSVLYMTYLIWFVPAL